MILVLLQLVQELRRELPYCGDVLFLGRLRSMGYFVTRSRLRDVIHTIDPISTALRWRGDIHARRPYSVPGPNSLWHIGKCSSYIIYITMKKCFIIFVDGHHKLIRWRFITHAGIDGYSRLIVFMECSTNNAASTVLSAFQRGVQKYGLPSRFRCDHGR